MLDILFIPIVLLYLLVVLLLLAHGINLFYMIILSWRTNQDKEIPPYPSDWPPVTVQLPIYNEMYVAERLILAAAKLDYPADRLEIQVLDDSDDETRDIASNSVSNLQSQGLNIHYLHRSDRSGFKSGALNAGLLTAKGEFIAIFDADFLPPPDFLKRTVPYFNDVRCGFVQTRWGHVNRGFSFLTVLQSVAIDAHFMVEQFARSRAGYWFNFNGTAGVWRRATIEDAGGWRSDTLTEDLDLSYRAFMRDWKAIYLRDVVSPAELPVSISAFRRQQHRWARGSLECAGKFLPLVWNKSIPLSKKIEATFHLLGYGIHLLLVALVILHPFVLYLSLQYKPLLSLFGLGVFFNISTFAQAAFIVTAQQQLGNRWWRLLPFLFLFAAAGAGLMINTTRAAVEILTKKKVSFERTPKYGITTNRETWTNRKYQIRFDPIIFIEIPFALLNTATAVLAIRNQNWIIAIYSILFALGLFLISGLTVSQSFAISFNHTRK